MTTHQSLAIKAANLGRHASGGSWTGRNNVSDLSRATIGNNPQRLAVNVTSKMKDLSKGQSSDDDLHMKLLLGLLHFHRFLKLAHGPDGVATS